MIALLTPMHMGGIPELAMALGPVLLIAVFIRIARRAEARQDDEDDWEDELPGADPVDTSVDGSGVQPSAVRAGRE